MAIKTGSVTSNGSFSSLTISGNTQQSRNMSWSSPTLPDGATITSTTLTANLTISMTRASCTVTINGTSYTESSSLNISLGTSLKTSLAVTAKGSNKNAIGTVSISNIVYTVNYQYDDGTTSDITITFKDYDGSIISSYASPTTSMFTVPNDPVRDGYTFAYWTHAEFGDFSKSQLELTTPELLGITKDVEFTAVYTQNITTYTVRFLDWNGNVLDTQTIEEGQSAGSPPYPTRDGYLNIGWDNDYSNITSNLDVTAQYVQEQGTPSDNIFPAFTSNSFNQYDSSRVQVKDYSISLSTPNGIGSMIMSLPTEWIGQEILISVSDRSSGPTLEIAGVDIYPGETYTITPTSDANQMVFYTNGQKVIWLTDIYARLPATTTQNIYLGNGKITNIYLGDTSIVKVYLGNSLIFEK